MTHARADSSTYPPGASRFRAPTDPARILPERRVPADVDRDGARPRTLADLSPAERSLYDAQMVALCAGRALIAALESLALTTERAESIRALGTDWVTARDAYHELLNARLQRRP